MERRKYMNKVKSALVCSKSTKTGLLKIIENDMNAYLSEHPDATEQDLVGRFGTPDALAESYLDSLDISEVNTQLKKTRSIKKVVLATLCAVAGILLLLVIGIKCLVFFHDLNAEYINEEPSNPMEPHDIVRYSSCLFTTLPFDDGTTT